jgi:hypothetical protein
MRQEGDGAVSTIISPFNWRERTEPGIFAKDPYFQPKGPQKRSHSEAATAAVETQRAQGIEPGSIKNLGKMTKEKEAALLAYKQFGPYSKTKSSVKKPNKHEAGGKP